MKPNKVTWSTYQFINSLNQFVQEQFNALQELHDELSAFLFRVWTIDELVDFLHKPIPDGAQKYQVQEVDQLPLVEENDIATCAAAVVVVVSPAALYPDVELWAKVVLLVAGRALPVVVVIVGVCRCFRRRLDGTV